MLFSCDNEGKDNFRFVFIDFENNVEKRFILKKVLQNKDSIIYKRAFLQSLKEDSVIVHLLDDGVVYDDIDFKFEGPSKYKILFNSQDTIDVYRVVKDINIDSKMYNHVYIYEVHYSELGYNDVYNIRYYFDRKSSLLIKGEIYTPSRIVSVFKVE